MLRQVKSLKDAGGQVVQLKVSAVDGGGQRAASDADIIVNIIGANQRPPVFTETLYHFSVGENASIATLVGTVVANGI